MKDLITNLGVSETSSSLPENAISSVKPAQVPDKVIAQAARMISFLIMVFAKKEVSEIY